MKQYVFIHESAIPEGKLFEEMTDEEILNVEETLLWTYRSFEEFIEDFNAEDSPSHHTCYGRVIEVEN